MRLSPWFCYSLAVSIPTALSLMAPSVQATPHLHAAAPEETDAPAVANEPENTALATAADLRITPRISADYNSPQAGDNSIGYSRLNAFIPIIQSPGESLTFLNTSVRLDTQDRLGANVAIGHRFLVDDLLWGGYLAYDLRDTTLGTFNQLGAGVEVYGTNWDAHLNGYLPIGTSSLTSGSLVTGTSFQGSQLLLTTGGTNQQAQGGVDVEAGLNLADLGQWGNLWGYGGTYWYGDNLGARLRLEQRSLNAFNLGLGIDTGGLGTNVFVSVGVGWGGTPRRPVAEVADAEQVDETALKQNTDETPADDTPGNGTSDTSDLGTLQAIWSRAANLPSRNSSIVIEQEVVPTGTQVAVNPDTGQPYVIRHVNPNSGNPNQGDGSVENPFTTLGMDNMDAGTGLGGVTAGEIIYVRAGDSRTNNLAAFIIPAGVQVYSEAVTQTLSTQQGQVTLPDSGSGIRPLVSGMGGITLTGGNNLLSGFEITNAADGITLSNVSGTVEVNNNLIRNSTNRALFLDQNTGSSTVIVENNTVETAAFDGLRFNLDGTFNLNLTLSNNQIRTITDTTTGDGIDVEANGNSVANLTITGNQITAAGNSGIELETCGANPATACDSSLTATVSDNTVSNSGGDGILFFHNSNQMAQLTISSNQVQNSGVGTPPTGVSNTGALTPITGNGGFGIVIATFADGDLTATIDGNTITNSQDEKIAIINNIVQNPVSATTVAAPTVNVAIRNNQASGTGTGTIAGTDITVVSGDTLADAANTPTVCVQIQNNTAANGNLLLNGAESTLAPVAVFLAGTFGRDNFVNPGTILEAGTIGGNAIQTRGTTNTVCTLP